jgi:O-antigen ligase
MTTAAAEKPVWHSLDNLISACLGLFAFSVVFSVTAVEAALLLTLILLLAKKYREKSLTAIGREVLGHPLFIPWAIYLGICLLTSITAYYPAKGFGQLNSDFLKFLCLFTLLLTVKKDHLPRLAAVYTAAAAASAVFGIAETVNSLLAGDVLTARAGVMMNAVRYGEAMTVAFMLAFCRILLPVKEYGARERLLYALAALLILAAVVLSQTRGAYLGLASGLLALSIFAPQVRKRLAVYTAVILAAVALITVTTPALRHRLISIGSYQRGDFAANSPNTGINVRIELWKLGYKMFKAHPIVGIGPDNVKRVFKKFNPGPFPEEGIYGTLNNLYIHQAAERGILGLGALLLLFGTMFMYSAKRFRATASPFALWALCALPAFYVVNITEISFQHVHTSFAIFMALAFAAAAGKETI